MNEGRPQRGDEDGDLGQGYKGQSPMPMGPSGLVQMIAAALLASLSVLAVRYGDYALALRCDRENLAWAEELSHQHRKSAILLGVALLNLLFS